MPYTLKQCGIPIPIHNAPNRFPKCPITLWLPIQSRVILVAKLFLIELNDLSFGNKLQANGKWMLGAIAIKPSDDYDVIMTNV